MEVVFGSCAVTAVLFAAFYFVYRINKTNLFSGFMFGFALSVLGMTFFLFSIQYTENIFLLYPIVALALVSIVVALFGIFILLAFLFINARTVFRKEGRSLSNSLTLVAGVGLVLLMIVSWFLVGHNPPVWLQALWAGIISLVFILSATIILFMTTALLCTLARPKLNKDYVIVLGSGLINGQVTPLLAGRIMRAISFARKQEAKGEIKPTLIMSGGQGADELMAEAEAMAQFAQEAQFDSAYILIEDNSKSTAENMLFSKAIMDARSPEGYRCVYATSSYHIMRAGIYARKAGLKIDGLSAETAWYFLPNAILREFIAWIALHKRRFILIAIAVFLLAAAAAGLPSYLLGSFV
ncbi:MAG: ElyC/SanA/YdcF family protein [Raoultibacter sp.]